MAIMKNAVALLCVFALFIMNICADTTSTTVLTSTLDGNPLSTTTNTDTWVHPDHPTSTDTATTWSSRPAASGFWTGPDPFSFIPPASLSTTRKPFTPLTTTTSASYSTTTSSSQDSYMSLDLPGTTSTASADTTTTTALIFSGTITSMISSVDVSISTHTNIVTAIPTVTTSLTVTGTTTESTTSSATLTVSSEGKNNKDEIALWIGSLVVMFGQYLI